MNDTHQTPEQRARGRIDRLLRDAGWQVQDMKDFNRNAALGVAVRDMTAGNRGRCMPAARRGATE